MIRGQKLSTPGLTRLKSFLLTPALSRREREERRPRWVGASAQRDTARLRSCSLSQRESSHELPKPAISAPELGAALLRGLGLLRCMVADQQVGPTRFRGSRHGPNAAH